MLLGHCKCGRASLVAISELSSALGSYRGQYCPSFDDIAQLEEVKNSFTKILKREIAQSYRVGA